MRSKLPSLKKLRKSPTFVKALMIQQFFEGFVPITALYAIMFERVGELNFSQIGVLFSIWSLAYLIAELPSGVLADYWSRRNVIIAGGLLRATGFMIWLLSPNFTGYAIGFAVWGIAIACTSGSVAAFLHNELKTIDKNQLYAKYLGWIVAMHWVGALLGFILAAVLTLRFSNALIITSIVSSVLFAVSLLLIRESTYTKQDTYLKTLGSGLREVASSKLLRFLCFVLFSVYMIIGVLEELLPRLFASFGLNDSLVAVALAVSLLLTIFVIARLESYVHFSLPTQILVMVVGVTLLLAGLYLGGFGGAFLVIAFSLVFQLFRPLLQHHVQEATVGDERATVGSIPGLAGGLLGAGAYAIMGFVAAKTSEIVSIGLYGAFWLICLLVLAFIGRKYTLSTPFSSSKPVQPVQSKL